MKFFSGAITLLSALLFGGAGVTAQLSGPDTLMVVDPLPVVVNVDSIDLNSPEFGLKTIPYHGKVISKFGRRGSRTHTGTDIKLLKGDSVRVAFDGVVDIAAAHYGYGLLVTVQHARQVKTYYAHLSKILVKKGQTVKAGEVIGLGGATGRATTAHLHFELRVGGKPINSQTYFDFENSAFLATVIKPKVVDKAKPAGAPIPTGSLHNAVHANGTATASTHVVVKGDTLYSIAKNYGTTVVDLCSLNGLSARSILRIGTVLKVR